MRIALQARRFFYDEKACLRQVFAERFEEGVGHHARRHGASRRNCPLPRDRSRWQAGRDTISAAQRQGERRHAASDRASPRRQVSRRRRSSASMIGRGSETTIMKRSSATSNAAERPRCSRVVSRRPLKLGWPASPRSASWRGPTAAAMRSRSSGLFRRPCRSPTDGI